MKLLRREVDGASLRVLRVVYGLAMALQCFKLVWSGAVRNHVLEPDFLFKYPGFSWVEPLPGLEMIVVVTGIAGLMLAAGLLQRISAGVLFLGWSYFFLLERALYLNHFYMMGLMAFLFALLPAPKKGARNVPALNVLAFRIQLGIVYVYAGIAKLGGDWLSGQPLEIWLQSSKDVWLIGGFLASHAGALTLAWGGMLLDFLIVPALRWRRTRVPAFFVAVGFHLMNALLFDIGIFPWLMIASTTIFLQPWWPRAMLGRALPRLTGEGKEPVSKLTAVLLALFLLVQVLLPFRHLLYPGPVNWTEEGHEFSWHMKLRDKHGTLSFRVVDPATGRRFDVDPAGDLNRRQFRKMIGRPDLIHQYALHLEDEFAARGIPDVEVYALSRVSLNGRPMQRLIDPEVDLSSIPRSASPSAFIVPLNDPGR